MFSSPLRIFLHFHPITMLRVVRLEAQEAVMGPRPGLSVAANTLTFTEKAKVSCPWSANS